MGSIAQTSRDIGYGRNFIHNVITGKKKGWYRGCVYFSKTLMSKNSIPTMSLDQFVAYIKEVKTIPVQNRVY